MTSDESPPASSLPAPSIKHKIMKDGTIAILCALFGFGLVVQLHSNESESTLQSARQDDLVRILDDLSSRQERLRQEIVSLEQSRSEITSDRVGGSAALQEAQRRIRDMEILAGLVPVNGPGITLTITEQAHLKAAVILNAIEELRGAGAEAIEIRGANNEAVRIGTSSYVVDAEPGITIDGKNVTAPYSVNAIGDSATMETAMTIPGGVLDLVKQAKGTLKIEKKKSLSIQQTRQTGENASSKAGS